MPLSIEVSNKTEASLIVGYNTNTDEAHILPLSFVKRIVVTNAVQIIKQEHCDFVYNTLEEYCKEVEEAKE